jgi:hypothetical protein
MDENTRNELDELAGETFALQTLFLSLVGHLQLRDRAIVRVFDEAADIVENLALGGAQSIRHLPHAIRVIEELRTGVSGKSKPKDAV